MVFKLKLVLATAASVAFATGALAAGNGNGNGNPGQGVSFNAVANSNGLPAALLPQSNSAPTGGPSNGLGGLASGLAHSGGGTAVALAAGGNPNVVPQVPEPDAYLMLLAGLGMVGLIARRRASR